MNDDLKDIYNPIFVENLFDEMSATYDIVNLFSSFGFSQRWRNQLVKKAGIQPGMLVCDLMCGMGESWGAIIKQIGDQGNLIAIDFSEGMLRGARKRRAKIDPGQVTLLQVNALANSFENDSLDVIVCGFGIKTLSQEQLVELAHEIYRILKPGGTFSFVEISVPKGWFFEGLFMTFLKSIVPVVGRLFLGNPENYRMLGIYTEKFGNCRDVYALLNRIGMNVRYDSFFYGCATGVSGVKPVN
jgi:demethylmenaquinone methyltransferase/2-methoxy-6-polyprenyl-1,4-benzoquinol methylase